MAMENKRIIQLSTERLTLNGDDYVMVDSETDGSAKYRLDRLKETDSTLSVSGMAADAAATGQAISEETQARTQAVTAESQARQQAITAESQARQAADTALGNDVDDLKSALESLYEESSGQNLIDPSKMITGAVQSDGSISTVGSWANYSTSDYIELEENTDYVFQFYNPSDLVAQTARKIICVFDSRKQSISESYQNISGQTYVTFNTSTTIKYARVTAETGFDYQLAKGSSSIAYTPYSPIKSLAIELGEIPVEQVEKLIADNSVLTASKNLIDATKSVTGAIQSTGAIATNGSWGFYATYDYIELEENTNYVLATYNTDGSTSLDRKLVLLYDANKVPDSETYQNVTSTSATFNSGTNYKYARVAAEATLPIQLEKGITPTDYTEYSIMMNYNLGDIPMAQAEKGNALYGKKWVVCGDSFTNGATSNTISDGKFKGRRIVYPYLIGNRNNMDIISFFAGGRTLAYPANPDGFTNSLTCPTETWYYQNIPADADYITIYLGINDSHHESGQGGDGEDPTGVIPLGTIDDNTTATYYGAWNVVLTWLIANRPFAHIGIIVSNGCDRVAYREAQLAIAEKYGIPYIDLNGDSRTPAMIRSQNPNIAEAVKTAVTQKQAVDYPNNTHPNDNAHIYESYFIENFLRSI